MTERLWRVWGSWVANDFEYGLRQLRRAPMFVVAVIGVLALGVGAVTAVFARSDGILFRALPYPDFEQLVTIRVSGEGTWLGLLQYEDVERLASEHQGFSAVGAFAPVAWGTIEGTSGRTAAYAVTSGFLDALAVRPLVGRSFLPGEYRPLSEGGGDVALISHDLWRSAFGGQADVLGRTLVVRGLQSARYRVIGVLPGTFVFPDHLNQPPDILVPGALDSGRRADPGARTNPIARLRPGVSVRAAAAEMQRIITAVERDFAEFPQGRGVEVTPLRDALFTRVRVPLLVLLGATAGLLVLACANLACLCAGRLRSRGRELSIRAAVGASAGRMVRQICAELLVVAGLGGIAAIVTAQWMLTLIMSRTPEVARIYRLLPVQFDLRVLAFTGALTMVAMAVFGLVPAVRVVRATVGGGMRCEGIRAGRSRLRFLHGHLVLIFVQTAVSTGLLLGGVLVVRSFLHLALQPLGFHPEQVTAAYVEPRVPPGRELDLERAMGLQRRAYEELRVRLGEPVGVSIGMPGMHLPGTLGRPDAPRTGRRVLAQRVAGDFFEVFGLTLEAGRWFDGEEGFRNAPVAVLDRRAAENLWPGESSLGKLVRDEQDTLRSVVGVVGTIRTSLTRTERPGNAFVPLGNGPRFLDMSFNLAGTGWSSEDVRSMIQEVVPSTNVDVVPLRAFERSLEQPRFLGWVLGAVGVLAMVLTAFGVFGVLSDDVARRRGEIGVRMALGAGPRQIRWFVLRRALAPGAVGVAVGLMVSMWWTETMRSVLYGVDSHDPATVIGTALFMLGLVGVAGLSPAWRASRSDPLSVIKELGATQG